MTQSLGTQCIESVFLNKHVSNKFPNVVFLIYHIFITLIDNYH